MGALVLELDGLEFNTASACYSCYPKMGRPDLVWSVSEFNKIINTNRNAFKSQMSSFSFFFLLSEILYKP